MGLAIYNRINQPENETVGVAAHVGGFLAGNSLSVVWERWDREGES